MRTLYYILIFVLTGIAANYIAAIYLMACPIDPATGTETACMGSPYLRLFMFTVPGAVIGGFIGWVISWRSNRQNYLDSESEK
jgi:hypothetical protein